MEKLLRGILAGTFATLPMTAAMLGLRSQLPREWLKPLPPRQITMRLADRLRFRRKLDGDGKRRLTWLSHFGYGALAGGLYASLPRRIAGAGPVFGLGLWAVSYLGLMPALSLYRPAVKDPPARNILMIASHLVWGLFLGACFRLLRGPMRPIRFNWG